MSARVPGTLTRTVRAGINRRRRIRTFDRGIDLPHHKQYSDRRPVERLPLPPELVIPLLQHKGTIVEPLVAVGDHVEAGEKIGDLDDRWCAAVHAGASGTVTAVEPRPFGDGTEVLSVVIETDRDRDPRRDGPGGERWTERPGWTDLSVEQTLAILKDCGIVGMAGAGFPTHINVAVRTRIPRLIINGAECEPFLTSDHRTMVERLDAVIGGAEILARLIGADTIFFGVETNKPDAIGLLQERTRDVPHMQVVPVAVKYPQGYKKTLLRAITGKEPPLGGRSADVGCIVRNVSTTAAIYDAVVRGKPLYERIVTVTGPGSVERAGNYLVPIGTPIRYILEQVGIDAHDLDGYKIIRGGPMTGLAVDTLDAPIVKASSGVLVMPPASIQPEHHEIAPCIRCSACVSRCPVGLYPNEISQLVEAGTPEAALALHINECCECAICSYVCPAYRPVTHLVMEGKAMLRSRERTA